MSAFEIEPSDVLDEPAPWDLNWRSGCCQVLTVVSLSLDLHTYSFTLPPNFVKLLLDHPLSGPFSTSSNDIAIASIALPARFTGVMSIPKLPALRLMADGDCIVEEGVYLDLSPKSPHNYSSPPSEGRQNMALGSSGKLSTTRPISTEVLPQQPGPEDNSYDQVAPPPLREQPIKRIPERFNMTRTISMPLPSQLSQLQHPHKFKASTSLQGTHAHSPYVSEVSMELADSIQLAIQTMLQISPPQVLDPAKEQFSACALSVPTSSMSALFTAMKNINYISANMSSFCDQSGPSDQKLNNEFDVGEMLQCVGDALSGAAAQSSVDLVIYHGDVGLKHVYVSGDESGIAFALSHVSNFSSSAHPSLILLSLDHSTGIDYCGERRFN